MHVTVRFDFWKKFLQWIEQNKKIGKEKHIQAQQFFKDSLQRSNFILLVARRQEVLQLCVSVDKTKPIIEEN